MGSYCVVAEKIINENPPPYKMHVDVLEYADEPGACYVAIYVQDYVDLPRYKVQYIVDWLNQLLGKLNTHPLVGAKYSYRIMEENPQ